MNGRNRHFSVFAARVQDGASRSVLVGKCSGGKLMNVMTLTTKWGVEGGGGVWRHSAVVTATTVGIMS